MAAVAPASPAGLAPAGIRVTIPWRDDARPGARIAKAVYRTRNAVERRLNRLKQYRRVATRYETRAANRRAMRTLAALRLWLCDGNTP